MQGAPFGRTPDGSEARLFTLENAAGFRADITDYGGAIVRLLAPDRDGHLGDVVLGFNSAADYAAHPFFCGAIIGRFANRIAAGRFSLDGNTHQLSLNDGPENARCQLHGGLHGFNRHLWRAESGSAADSRSLKLSRRSPDGEEGYPGNLVVTVTYTLAADCNDLRVDFSATTDRATPVNLSSHPYFNLRCNSAGDVLGHIVQIKASAFTPIDSALIPRGSIDPVAGTPFDFRTPQAIGERISSDDEQLRLAGGYDHNFVLDGGGGTLALAASVHDPTSGRTLEVLTTQPGLQFYTGNHLDGSWRGKLGRTYAKRSGFCLEAQHFPDAPNQPSFPSTILRPGQTFRSTIIYRLRVDPK